MLDARAIDVLRDIVAEVCAHTQATLVEMDGEYDHVHVLIHDSFAVGAILPDLKDGLTARSGQHPVGWSRAAELPVVGHDHATY